MQETSLFSSILVKGRRLMSFSYCLGKRKKRILPTGKPFAIRLLRTSTRRIDVGAAFPSNPLLFFLFFRSPSKEIAEENPDGQTFLKWSNGDR